MRRRDETCVKQRRSDRDPDRASGRAETRKAAARGGCGDAGDDQPVPEGAPAEAPHRDHDDGERPGDVRDDREQAGRHEGEVVLRRRDAVRRKGAVNRHRERDADGEARVDEDDRRGAAAAGEEERARAQERRRE